MKYLLIFTALTLWTGCQKKGGGDSVKYERVEIPEIDFNIILPQKMWDHVLRQSPPTIKYGASIYDLVEPLSMEVKLIEKTEGVLGGKNYLLDLSKFGGVLDYSKYIKEGERGGFALKFTPSIEGDEEIEDYKVFYLSWVPTKKNKKEVLGNGCNVLYDLTSFFKKKAFEEGILLHTNKNRYFHLTAGRYYFVYYSKYKIWLSQITVQDKGLESQLCPNKI